MSISNNQIVSANRQLVEYLYESKLLPKSGRLLDIGCGKGLFLREFRLKFPKWEVAGIELSDTAFVELKKEMPDVPLHHGGFENSPFRNEKFDLVVAANVLEHVPDPLPFLSGVESVMSPNGLAYIVVPNFENNPSDLITFDHLSRFTPKSIVWAFNAVGLNPALLNVSSSRVSMSVLANRGKCESASIDSPAFAHASVAWLATAYDVFDKLSELPTDHRVGIYGTGLLALGAHALGRISAEKVAAVFDDNPHFQGTTKLGRRVSSLAECVELGITDITFSANPVYFEQMRARVSANCPGVKLWTLPALEFSRQIET
ncbi:MAG TPA: class I SAM-dependent methyltransferase [Xanthobacteraceae bacterium]|nr:class I SAM-dependent methyltransferase [Xanthobacteraceae bacterium]